MISRKLSYLKSKAVLTLRNSRNVALFSFSSFPLHNSALCLNSSFLAYRISPLKTENYTYTDIETELLDIGCAFVRNLLPQRKQLSSPIPFSNVGNEFAAYAEILKKADISAKFVANIKIVFENSGTEHIFGQADIMAWLECSKSKATNVMNAMKKAEIVIKVKGFGAGKYRFIEK